MFSFISMLFDTAQILMVVGAIAIFTIGVSYVLSIFKPLWIRPFLIIVFLVSVVGGFYYESIQNAKKIALMQYNQTQLEQNIKDQQTLIKKQQELTVIQEAIQKQLTEQANKLNVKIGALNTYLSSSEAQKSNRPSSVVLQTTIKSLAESK